MLKLIAREKYTTPLAATTTTTIGAAGTSSTTTTTPGRTYSIEKPGASQGQTGDSSSTSNL